MWERKLYRLFYHSPVPWSHCATGQTMMQRRLHCGTPSPPPPPKGEHCCKVSHGPIGRAVAGSGRTDSEEEKGGGGAGGGGVGEGRGGGEGGKEGGKLLH